MKSNVGRRPSHCDKDILKKIVEVASSEKISESMLNPGFWIKVAEVLNKDASAPKSSKEWRLVLLL